MITIGLRGSRFISRCFVYQIFIWSIITCLGWRLSLPDPQIAELEKKIQAVKNENLAIQSRNAQLKEALESPPEIDIMSGSAQVVPRR